MLLKFESVAGPVRVAKGMKVLPHLVRVFAKWPFREIPEPDADNAQINVLQDGEGYVLEAPWLDSGQRYEDAARFADGLPRHMVRQRLEENPHLLSIEAAATQFGKDLVVFLGGPGSGKSFLVSCLAAAGHTAFADSILPLSAETGFGMGLGIAPRIRLPLPEGFSGPIRTLLEERIASGVQNLGYLRPRGAELAGLGEMAAIRAFVILDRTHEGCSLRPASPGAVLKRLLLNSSDTLPSTRSALKLLHRLVADTPCHRLRWSDPQEAINSLRAQFAVWRPHGEGSDRRMNAMPRTLPRAAAAVPRDPSGRLFQHVDGLEERQLDNDLFLADGDGIYHLNGLGIGLWRLLDGSHGENDAVSLLREAYPLADCDDLARDVERLIDDLTEHGLLVEKKTGEAG